MPTYAFQAVDGTGKRLRGQAQAASTGALTRTLEERGLLVLDVAESADGSPLAIETTRTDDDATFEIESRWVGEPGPERWRVRAAAIALLGLIAESTSLIHESFDPDGVATYELVTGMLPDDTAFATHGHTLRLRVRVDA